MKRTPFAPRLAASIALALSLILGGCGAPTSLPDEPYEPVDYTLFPAPEGAYVGDTMPFVTEDGELELYYLYDTDHNGQGYIDDEKALSARIGHSTNGAHIGVFAEACDASFSNITMKLPE